jgi:hypothetical protein
MLGLIFLTVLLVLVIFISGYRLSRRGKPYGTLLLTIHKLIPLGMLIYLGIAVNRMKPLTTPAVALSFTAGFFYLLLIASGGVISATKEAPAWVKLAHKVLPYLAALTTGIALYLIVNYR